LGKRTVLTRKRGKKKFLLSLPERRRPGGEGIVKTHHGRITGRDEVPFRWFRDQRVRFETGARPFLGPYIESTMRRIEKKRREKGESVDAVLVKGNLYGTARKKGKKENETPKPSTGGKFNPSSTGSRAGRDRRSVSKKCPSRVGSGEDDEGGVLLLVSKKKLKVNGQDNDP